MSFLAKYIGQKVKRTEDPRLIQGIGHYVDDIRLADTLHVAVYTGSDVEGRVGYVPCAAALPDLKVPKYPVLALDKVIFVGQPIAAVVATDKYKARDAVDLIEIDYDPLDVVSDVEAGAKADSPVIHKEFGTNVAYLHSAGVGDVEAAFKQADRVVSQRLVHQRL